VIEYEKRKDWRFQTAHSGLCRAAPAVLWHPAPFAVRRIAGIRDADLAYNGGLFAVVGVIGFIWYLKRGCATCPRNEGRCSPGLACATEENSINDKGKPPR
jgi:hypothetical protein